MKNNKLKFNAIVALLLGAGLISAPAAMAASASASLGPITITTVALEPGATLTWGSEYNYGYAYAGNTDVGAYDSQSYSGSDWDSLFSTLASVPFADASASSTPSASGPTLLSTADALQTTTLSPAYTQYTYGQGYTYDQLNFTTSGAMAIYVTADYSIVADPGDGSTYGYSYAIAQLYGTFSSSDDIYNYTYSYSQDDVTSSADYYYNYGIASDSGVLGFGIITAGNGTGYLQGYTQAYAYQHALPVPEPETYAMLLVGLGLVGFAALRRKVS